MEFKQLGEIIPGAAEASQVSRSNVPTKPSSNSFPPADLECDYQIPQRVFSAWVPEHGERELVRALTATEHSKLVLRQDVLRSALSPYSPRQQPAVEAQIMAMLSGFRSMRQQDDDAKAVAHITAHVLRDFPAWAIGQACMLIARRQAGLNPSFPPNDAEIYGVCDRLVAPYRKALRTIGQVLVAPVEKRQPPRREAVNAGAI